MDKITKPNLSVIYENYIDIDEINCTSNFLGRITEEESKYNINMKFTSNNQLLENDIMTDNTKKLIQNFRMENDLCKNYQRLFLKSGQNMAASFNTFISLNSEILTFKKKNMSTPINEKKIRHILDVNLELQNNKKRDKSPITSVKTEIPVYNNFNQTIRLFE